MTRPRLAAFEVAPDTDISIAGARSDQKLAAIITPAANPSMPSMTLLLGWRLTNTNDAPSAVSPQVKSVAVSAWVSYEIMDPGTGPMLSTGDVATPEVRVVSENRNFTILGPLNQPHMVLRGSPLPPLPIDYAVLSDPLVQVQSSLKFKTLIPALDPPPVDPYFNTEFFIGIETNDPIEFVIPSPSPFLMIPIDENTDPTEKERLSNKFGAERIGRCNGGTWKCAKIEFGDGFTFETEIFVDGFESGNINSWSTGAAADNSSRTDKEGAVGVLTADRKLPVLTEEDLKKAIELFNDDTVFDEKTIGLVSERFGILEPLPPATGTYFFDSFGSFRSIGAPVGPTLDGSGCPAPCSGLVLEGGNSGVNGIRFEGFPDYGVAILSDGNSITRAELISNGSGGLRINGNNNVVGGAKRTATSSPIMEAQGWSSNPVPETPCSRRVAPRE